MQVLATAFNDGADRLVPGFIMQFKPNFPMGFSPRESVQEFLARPQWKRSYVPEFMFIDRKRVVREQHSGEEPFFVHSEEDKNVRVVLDNLLKEPAAAKKAAAPARKTAVKKTS